MLTTYAQQIAFLMQHDILPRTGLCHKCKMPIEGDCKEGKTNEWFWKCRVCKVTTSIRYGTVLYKSKMKLQNWILLAYCFIERNRTYAQTSNEASLPMEGYEDRTLSPSTINRWFRFFRSLCRKDFKRMRVKIGGVGKILEGDESLFGKLKYGRGYGKHRRRAWVFGMVERETGRLFVYVCPKDSEGKYKRTRKALIPMILANVLPGTTLFTDGWRAYRRLNELGYTHRWVNHDVNFVDKEDRSLHTNRIEGLWGQIKRWLPQSGSYCLEEYLELYQWFQMQKRNGVNPFWRLLQLIAEHNEYEEVNAAQYDEEHDVVGGPDDAFLAEDDEDIEEEEYFSDEEEHYWW